MKIAPRAAALLLGLLASCKDVPRPSPAAPGSPPPPDRTTAITTSSNAILEPRLPAWSPEGKLVVVAVFASAMPTGVTVSRGGRVFVTFPRCGDEVPFTVAEVKEGRTTSFPNDAVNRAPAAGKLASGFVSVQSVVVDARDRLWVLDTGSVKRGKSELGGPKLVGIDLQSNAIFKTIVFPREVATATSYPSDVRFDLRRGKAGIAYVTDSASEGPNGIIVVDLDSGRSWRKLDDHPSTRAEKGFLPFPEGRAMITREPGKPPRPLAVGADGIAISNDGKLLYYCPLASRRLYAVSTDALADEKLPDAEVARTVKDLGEKGASDGLESDAEGRVYVTNYETNAITRRKPDGTFETLVSDPTLLWPDTLSLASDSHLYITANQLHRQPQFNEGTDRRQKPYVLYKVKVDGTPVALQ